MKILIVISDLSYRGGERFFANLCRGLVTEHKVYLVPAVVGEKPRPFSPKVTILRPPKIISLIGRKGGILALVSFPFTFISTLKWGRKADVIYAGGAFTAIWPATIAAKILTKRIFWGIFDLTTLPSPLYMLHRKIAPSIEKILATWIRGVILIDKSLEPLARKRFGIKNIRTIVSGFDPKVFENAEAETFFISKHHLVGRKVLLQAGAIHPLKGPDLAIKVLARVKAKFPSCVLLLVGGGSAGYISQLKRDAQRLGVSDNLFLPGVVPEKELKNYFLASDMVLHCGKIVGYTALEAVYLGKMPIYHSSGQPLGAVLSELKVGLRVREKSVSEFSRKIILYLGNPLRYEKKLKNDRDIILKEFSLKTFVAKTLLFLQS